VAIINPLHPFAFVRIARSVEQTLINESLSYGGIDRRIDFSGVAKDRFPLGDRGSFAIKIDVMGIDFDGGEFVVQGEFDRRGGFGRGVHFLYHFFTRAIASDVAAKCA
jgi:hypothetical protein